MNHDLDIVIESLMSGRAAAFLGAGMSRTFRERGRTFIGYPSAFEVVEDWRRHKRYLPAELTYPEAAFLLKHREGRGFLVESLQRIFARPLDPLPAHRYLARLPFAAFITTNYDRLLESALEDEGRSSLPIVDDQDVPLLRNAQVPVIKYHGCVSRPQTLVAAADEYAPLNQRYPLIASLMRVALANKTILFLGFGLDDPDFTILFDELRQLLGDYMPRSFAVMKDASDFKVEFWESKGVTLLQADATSYCAQLHRAHLERFIRRLPEFAGSVPSSSTKYVESNVATGFDPIDDPYIERMNDVFNLRSETQIIDGFLDTLCTQLEGSDDIATARESALQFLDAVCQMRPAYEGLRKIRHRIHEEVLVDGYSVADARQATNRLIEDRQLTPSRIGRKAHGLITRGERILVYSQSRRVVDFLRGVRPDVQQQSTLHVAECRVKSPSVMQDAIAIIKRLEQTAFRFRMLPDMAAAQALANRQIDRLIIGAHSVSLRDGVPSHFVNTGGTEVLVTLAEAANIPTVVVVDALKLVDVPADGPDLTRDGDAERTGGHYFGIDTMLGLAASGHDGADEPVYVGYDRCRWRDNFILISDQ